ncbi:MAG: MBL fold metallo-hydrolase [Lentisphaeria bacterium]|nr:MBL fold metallo-hydrolase [Lentisphaeria bacterium]
MERPWEGAFEPFRVFGNTFFSGTIPASTHLIDTGSGLIVIDTGYQETLYLMLDSLRKLGFVPGDIRYIVHSHGHIDHAGATKALVELTGAETFIGTGDLDMVTGKRPLSWAPEYDMTFPGVFEPDHLLRDGDRITLGNVTVECVATPGHSPGTFSLFWNAGEKDGRTVRAGMMGGAGLNTMASWYIRKYHLEEEDWRGAFAASLERCRREHVDLFIGNHTGQNRMKEKFFRLQAGDADAFIDENAWGKFLDGCEKDFSALLEKDPL